MRTSILAIAIVVLALSNCAFAQTSPGFGAWLDSLDFKELKKRAMQHDTTLDFSELRFAFTKTRSYDPYGNKIDKLEDKMRIAANKGDFEECLGSARKIIDREFTNVRAHFYAAISCDSTNMPHAAEFHRWIWTKLLHSILSSGDGKSPQTAYVVISIAEEYRVLQARGLQLLQQALIEDSIGAFDALTAISVENQTDTSVI
jgi:hypothetical protein